MNDTKPINIENICLKNEQNDKGNNSLSPKEQLLYHNLNIFNVNITNRRGLLLHFCKDKF